MNDLVSHDPAWPAIPNKIPSDIPKFEGKAEKDPSEHVTTFHLWCSSNSLHDNSIRLRLFQRTLTEPVAKWYIELPRGEFVLFDDLSMTFLNHFHYLYVPTLVPNSFQPSGKINPHKFWITLKSGVDRSSWLNPLYHWNLSLSGSSSRWYFTSRRMFLHLESKTRNK